MTGAGDEFNLIATHFSRLATTPEARLLQDDVAVLAANGRLVLTTDAIVEGVHFRTSDPVDTIGRKALRVNLSDLAAKGARPRGYLLTLAWPDTRPAQEIAALAAGLEGDQHAFGCVLLGGDTTRTPGPLTLSVTALGEPLGVRIPARCDARENDDLWVTGCIGDGFLGLGVLEGRVRLDPGPSAYLAGRYRTPDPRVSFAAAVSQFARASMDVSDGLLGDAAKIAAASGLRLRIDPGAIPLSPAARDWLGQQPDRTAGLGLLANGGDDYEILFTAPGAARAALLEAAADIGLALTCIGRAEAGQGVEAGGLPIGGHVHRLGASTNGKPPG